MKRRHAFWEACALRRLAPSRKPMPGATERPLCCSLPHDVDTLARSIVRDLRLIVRKSRWDSSKACRVRLKGAGPTEKHSNLPRRWVPPRTLPHVVEFTHKVNTSRIGWTTYFPIFFGDTFKSVPWQGCRNRMRKQ